MIVFMTVKLTRYSARWQIFLLRSCVCVCFCECYWHCAPVLWPTYRL